MGLSEQRVRALVKQTAANEVLEEHEVDLFLHECESKAVQPLSGLIVPTIRRVKQKDGSWKRRLTFVTTIDLMRCRADETGDYAPGRPTEFDMEGDTPQRARAFVVKFVHGHLVEFSEEAEWSEYYPGDGNVGAMWRKMPKVMLGKCAEARALRRGFPRALHHLYLREEMDQAEARETEAGAETKQERLRRARAAADEVAGSQVPEEPTEAEAPQALSSEEQKIRDEFVAGLSKLAELEKGADYVRSFDYSTATDLLKRILNADYHTWQHDRRATEQKRRDAATNGAS